MRGPWIVLLLAAGCFADADNVQGGTTGESESDGSGSEGASASSTSAGTSSSGSTSTTTTGPGDTSTSTSTDDEAGESGSSTGTESGDSTGSAGASAYESCVADEECASQICLMADAAEGGYCTTTCEAHEDCEGFPVLPSGTTISCAGTWGPNGEPLCLLSCFQDPPGECPAGTTCGTHDYNGEPSGGLCG